MVPSTLGPSPQICHGRVPWMPSLLTAIHAVISEMIPISVESSVPSDFKGKFSSRLPLRLTMSTSRSMHCFGVLYLASRS